MVGTSVAVSGIAVCGDGSAVVDRLDGGFVTPLAGMMVGIACAGAAKANSTRAEHTPRRAIVATEPAREQRRHPASHPKTGRSIRHPLSRFLESSAEGWCGTYRHDHCAQAEPQGVWAHGAYLMRGLRRVQPGVWHVIGHPAYQTPPGSGDEGLGEVGDDVVEGWTLTVR